MWCQTYLLGLWSVGTAEDIFCSSTIEIIACFMVSSLHRRVTINLVRLFNILISQCSTLKDATAYNGLSATTNYGRTCFILRNTPRQGFIAILQPKSPLEGSWNVSNIDRLNRMLPTADCVALIVRICNPRTSASMKSSLPTLDSDWMAFAMTSKKSKSRLIVIFML